MMWTTVETFIGLVFVCCPVIGILIPELKERPSASTQEEYEMGEMGDEVPSTDRNKSIPWRERASKWLGRRRMSNEDWASLGGGIIRTLSIRVEVEDRYPKPVDVT